MSNINISTSTSTNISTNIYRQQNNTRIAQKPEEPHISHRKNQKESDRNGEPELENKI